MKFYGKAEAVATKIIEAFKTGNVPKALARVFIKRAGRHCDGYSWTNQLLVALSGWDDAMGYGGKDGTSGWLSVGRRVKAGERCTHILAPCVRKVDDPKADGGTRTVIFGFRSVAVFGVEQTVIENPELWAKHNKGNADADAFLSELPLVDVAKNWGLTLKAYSGREAGALGWYRRGQAIALGVENLATWAHELCHAADDRNGKLVEHGQHWRSETVAELGGAILMHAMGYEQDADLGGAWEYISKYAETANIEPVKACMDVLKRTCEAVAMILEAGNADSDTLMSPDSDTLMSPDSDTDMTPDSDTDMTPDSDTDMTPDDSVAVAA